MKFFVILALAFVSHLIYNLESRKINNDLIAGLPRQPTKDYDIVILLFLLSVFHLVRISLK